MGPELAVIERDGRLVGLLSQAMLQEAVRDFGSDGGEIASAPDDHQLIAPHAPAADLVEQLGQLSTNSCSSSGMGSSRGPWTRARSFPPFAERRRKRVRARALSRANRAALLRGPVLSPVDAGRVEAFADGFVRIGPDGRIADVGPWSQVPDPDAALDLGATLILPAFVDAHVHLPQLDARARYGVPLPRWLARDVYPAEAAFADPEHAARASARFFGALAAAGTGTAGVFATVHADATERAFEAAEASGLRVVMGKVLMDREAPEALLEPAADGIRATRALADRWEGAGGGRLSVAVTPRFAPACSAELLSAAGALARDAGLRVQTHLAESTDEIAAVRRGFPESADYLEIYERAGLAGERSIFAHSIHLGRSEFERLAGAGAAGRAWTSNAFLGAGAFPLATRGRRGSRSASARTSGPGRSCPFSTSDGTSRTSTGRQPKKFSTAPRSAAPARSVSTARPAASPRPRRGCSPARSAGGRDRRPTGPFRPVRVPPARDAGRRPLRRRRPRARQPRDRARRLNVSR